MILFNYWLLNSKWWFSNCVDLFWNFCLPFLQHYDLFANNFRNIFENCDIFLKIVAFSLKIVAFFLKMMNLFLRNFGPFSLDCDYGGCSCTPCTPLATYVPDLVIVQSGSDQFWGCASSFSHVTLYMKSCPFLSILVYDRQLSKHVQTCLFLSMVCWVYTHKCPNTAFLRYNVLWGKWPEFPSSGIL